MRLALLLVGLVLVSCAHVRAIDDGGAGGGDDQQQQQGQQQDAGAITVLPPPPPHFGPGLLNPFANAGFPSQNELHPNYKQLAGNNRHYSTQDLVLAPKSTFIELEETDNGGETQGEEELEVLPRPQAEMGHGPQNPFYKAGYPRLFNLPRTVGEERFDRGLSPVPEIGSNDWIISPKPPQEQESLLQVSEQMLEESNQEESFMVPLPPVGFPDGYNPWRSNLQQAQEKRMQLNILSQPPQSNTDAAEEQEAAVQRALQQGQNGQSGSFLETGMEVDDGCINCRYL